MSKKKSRNLKLVGAVPQCSTACRKCGAESGRALMAIKSFLHSGLERFAKEGCVAGIGGHHAPKLNTLLAQLSLSGGNLKALMEIPGFHSVKKQFQSSTLSVKVSGSWRLTFKVANDGTICDLDYLQYH